MRSSLVTRIVMNAILLGSLVGAMALFGTPVRAVTELQTRDSAFSLLIVAFGEVQTSLIESDYEARLRAASSIHDPATRSPVRELARQERELRLRKLNRQLAELSAAYVHSRQPVPDEESSGPVPPAKVDTAAAHQTRKSFVIVEAATIETESETNAPGARGSH